MFNDVVLPPIADSVRSGGDRQFSTALPYDDFARFSADATARRVTPYKLAKHVLRAYVQGDMVLVSDIKRYLFSSNPALLEQIIKEYQLKNWQEN